MAISTKRPRRIKAAGSPEPMESMSNMGPSCGHGGCGLSCSVRYVGPTSPMHNHHIVNAARGASQVWTAAIVAGLAVVLTGAIAYTAVQAGTISSVENPTGAILVELKAIETRLDQMNRRLDGLASQCTAQTGQCAPTGTRPGISGMPGTSPSASVTGGGSVPSSTASSCPQTCQATNRDCQASARTLYGSCSAACEADAKTADPKACRAQCLTTYKSSTTTCASSAQTCQSSCGGSNADAAPQIPR